MKCFNIKKYFYINYVFIIFGDLHKSNINIFFPKTEMQINLR